MLILERIFQSCCGIGNNSSTDQLENSQQIKKSIKDLSDNEIKQKKFLVRCDLNVPLDGMNITDDTRIRSSLPTIEYLITKKAAVIAICSHLGRPKDGPEAKFSLAPCAEHMSKLLGRTVELAPDCIGGKVNQLVAKGYDKSSADGNSCIVILLENTRFYKEETKNDPVFAAKLALPFDVYINDAFGTAHRGHASTEGVTKHLSPCVSGFLLAKELEYLDGAISSGKKPMAAIVGGSKVSSKITVLNSLLEKCDIIIIGGGMVFTFLKAKGMEVGTSLVEDDFIETAKDVMAKADKLGREIILPVDIAIADSFSNDANRKVVAANSIPEGWMGLDNGPDSTEQQRKILNNCKTILMNGPMGVFEFSNYSKGTFALMEILSDCTKKNGATTIIGGGDSVAACEQSGHAGDMSHISTGGGASLELLEGKILPGVAALDNL